MVLSFGKVAVFLQILIYTSYDLSFSYVYPREMKTCPHENLVLKCLLTGEQLNKLWYINIMEYYLAIKKNELLMHAI